MKQLDFYTIGDTMLKQNQIAEVPEIVKTIKAREQAEKEAQEAKVRAIIEEGKRQREADAKALKERQEKFAADRQAKLDAELVEYLRREFFVKLRQ